MKKSKKYLISYQGIDSRDSIQRGNIIYICDKRDYRMDEDMYHELKRRIAKEVNKLHELPAGMRPRTMLAENVVITFIFPLE